MAEIKVKVDDERLIKLMKRVKKVERSVDKYKWKKAIRTKEKDT